jgi:hypothetical protein
MKSGMSIGTLALESFSTEPGSALEVFCGLVVLFCPAGFCVKDGIATAIPAMIIATAAAMRVSTILFAMNNREGHCDKRNLSNRSRYGGTL